MAGGQRLRRLAAVLVFLNLCMCIILSAIGGWALNYSIQNDYYIGAKLKTPNDFSPVYFPMGDSATGFFVAFALISGVVGAASCLAGVAHLRTWNADSLPAAQSSAITAWVLTVLVFGLAIKEINLGERNARLRTMEAFSSILAATQLAYALAIRGASSNWIPISG